MALIWISFSEALDQAHFKLLKTFSFLMHHKSSHIHINYVLETQLMFWCSFNFFPCFFLDYFYLLNTNLMWSSFKAFTIHEFMFFQFQQSFNVDWMVKIIFSSRLLLVAQKMNNFPVSFSSKGIKHCGKAQANHQWLENYAIATQLLMALSLLVYSIMRQLLSKLLVQNNLK